MSEDRFIIQSFSRMRNPNCGIAEDKNTFLTVSGNRFNSFKAFREELGMADLPYSTLEYFDEDDDLIPISSENEFKEFAKVVRKRTGKGMVTRLHYTCNVPLEDEKEANKEETAASQLTSELGVEAKNCEATAAAVLREHKRRKSGRAELYRKLMEMKAAVTEEPVPAQELNGYPDLNQLRAQIVQQVKTELLSDMKQLQPALTTEELGAVGPSVSSVPTGDEPHNKKKKYVLLQVPVPSNVSADKTKKDKPKEDQEQKWVPVNTSIPFGSSSVNRITFVTSEKLPDIMSGDAFRESFQLSKPVVVGKLFTHVWYITNDGTLPWKQVELRHIWSSPELEPKTKAIKCPPLAPGEMGQLEVKFRAPKTLKQILSYWHFHYEVNSQWMQFGHYVSVTGRTKERKNTIPEETSVAALSQGITRVLKLRAKSTNNQGTENKPDNTPNVAVEPQNSSEKKLDGNLASAKIAAEMEMEAARIAKETANNKKSSNNNSKTTKPYEKVVVRDLGANSSDSDNGTDGEDNSQDDFELVTVENCEGNKPNNTVEIVIKEVEKPLHESNTKVDNVETDSNPQLQPNASDTEECDGSTSTEPHQVPVCEAEANINRLEHYNPFAVPYHGTSDINTLYEYRQAPPYDEVNAPRDCYQHSHAVERFIDYCPDSQFPIISPEPYYNYRPVMPQLPTPTPPVPVITHYPIQTPHVHPVMPQLPQFPIQTPQHVHIIPAPAHFFEIPKSRTSADNVPQAVDVAQSSSINNTSAPVITDNSLVDVPANSVHILPQGLVKGAINVASSAYSTARKALNNLRVPEADSIKDFDPVFENNFALLVEMGFTNFERNARLLKRFNNDINQVIANICASPGGHNLDID